MNTLLSFEVKKIFNTGIQFLSFNCHAFQVICCGVFVQLFRAFDKSYKGFQYVCDVQRLSKQSQSSFQAEKLTIFCRTLTNLASNDSEFVHKTNPHQDKFNLSLSPFCILPGDLFWYVRSIHPNERGFYDLDLIRTPRRRWNN